MVGSIQVLTAAGFSSVIPINLRRFQFGVGLLVTLQGATTGTYTVQVTGDDVSQFFNPAVPIGLAEFFSLAPERTEKAFYAGEELVEIGKGRISYRQVGDTLFGRALQLLKERYEPGADTGRVPLVHDGEEGGIVLSGRLEVTVDDERRVLGPGDAYYFSSRRPHRFRCVGPHPCEVVSACTPPTF